MVFSSAIDTVLHKARRHAAVGEWAHALLILREHGEAARAVPELATMRTFGKPASFSTWRIRQIAAAVTPVPTR